MRPEHGGYLNQGSSPEGSTFLDFSVNINPYINLPTDSEWLELKQWLNLYPAPTTDRCDELISQFIDVSPAQILTTNGGIEAIRLALESVDPQRVVIPTPCFSEYPHICNQLGIEVFFNSIREENWQDCNEWLKIDFHSKKPTAILLANPNNPIGFSIPKEKLLHAINRSDPKQVTWIIDEAFVQFCNDTNATTLTKDLKSLPNTVICGALTKSWAVPGLRLGYVCTSSDTLITTMRAHQGTWPLNGFVEPWMKRNISSEGMNNQSLSITQTLQSRNKLWSELSKLDFLTPLPTDSNFILVKLKDGKTKDLDEFLLTQQIKVRSCQSIPGMENDSYLRIGVKQMGENKRLLDALKKFPNSKQKEAE